MSKQLKTIDAKIANGFLIKKGRTVDSSLKTKEIKYINLYHEDQKVCISTNVTSVTCKVLNNASL